MFRTVIVYGMKYALLRSHQDENLWMSILRVQMQVYMTSNIVRRGDVLSRVCAYLSKSMYLLFSEHEDPRKKNEATLTHSANDPGALLRPR